MADVVEYKPWSARNSLPKNELPARHGRRSGPLFVLRVALITALLIASGVSSGLSFYATGQVMQGYPTFLLYFCNGCYAVGYLVLLCIARILTAIRQDKGPPGASDAAAPLLSAQSTSAGRTAASSEFCGSTREQVAFLFIGVCTGLSLGALQLHRCSGHPDPLPHVPAFARSASTMLERSINDFFLSTPACSCAEMQQFANGKVDGVLQVVLYQLYLPATAICSRLYLRTKLAAWNIFGGLLVFGGCILVAVPGIQPSDSMVWPCVYALAALPLGMACVLQEEVFKEFPNCTVLKMSTWSTIYGVAFNVVTLPVSMLPNAVLKDVGNTSVPIYPHGATWDEFTTHQGNAFKCFFYGHAADGSGSDLADLSIDSLPEGCAADAWRPVVIYIVSYGINVFVCMALVKEMSAVFCVVFGATVLPATTICFSIGKLTVRRSSFYTRGSDQFPTYE